MKEYISLFETTAAYNAAKDNLDLPNVAYCKDQGGIYYAKENRIIATLNVSDISNPVSVCKSTSNFNSIEIDGVKMSPLSKTYTFDTTGEHEIKYTCKTDSIGSEFSGLAITKIYIPDNITNINYNTFADCQNLSYIDVNVNNSVYDSRNNCNAIIKTSNNQLITGSINTIIPDDVTSIGVLSFSGRNITSITIPSSVTNINDQAFNSCPLTSITVDSNNTIYRSESNAIIERSSNTLIVGSKNTTIPSSVTIIGSNAFYGRGKTTVSIPTSVIEIEGYAFYKCGLSSVNFQNTSSNPSNLKIIETSAFSYNNISSITLPNSITNVSSGFLSNNPNLGTINMSSIGTQGPYRALSGNLVYSSTIVQGSITGASGNITYPIQGSAFAGLNIQSIDLSSSSISSFAFKNCKLLKSIRSRSSSLSVSPGSIFDATTLPSSGTITIPNTSNYSSWRTWFTQRGWTIVTG